MTDLDAIRGHSFFPPNELLRSWPDLYATEKIRTPDKIVHAHFFVGSCDWWLMELDHADLRLAFGFVNLGDPACAELGYFDLGELAAVQMQHAAGFRLMVERDLHWTPKPFGQIGGAR